MKRCIAALLVCAVPVALVGCSGATTGASTFKEMEQTEENHQKLVIATPPPRIDQSLERQNLSKRLTRFNVPDKTSYIYLVSFGKVMAHYVMKGKVSSVNSLMTTPDQVVENWHSGNLSTHVINSPDLDGSYGDNGTAIFFFTATDAYVEWNGSYMLCDQPLRLSTPPELHIEVTEKP